MSRLRVLHVYKDYPPVLGGIEKHIQTLARHQVAAGLDVTVLVTNPAPFPSSLRTKVEEGPPRVIRASRWLTTASTPISPAQAWWQHRIVADIAHLHFPYPPGEIANYLWGHCRATVITYHSDVVRQQAILRLYRPLLRRILRHADAILATSPAYVQTSPFLAEIPERVRIVPLGVDVTPFLRVDKEKAAALRQRLSTAPDIPLLLFVGRLRYYKGVDILLRALVHLPPSVVLWVVGRGPGEAQLHALAHSLNLTSRVRFVGDVPEEELPYYYAAADVFVLPATSRAEAFGLVLVEAMATGLPVVSTELRTGTSFVNVHGETGYVVPPRDVDALVQALQALLRDPALRRRMGKAARKRAVQEFDAHVMSQRVLNVYQEVLEHTSTKG